MDTINSNIPKLTENEVKPKIRQKSKDSRKISSVPWSLNIRKNLRLLMMRLSRALKENAEKLVIEQDVHVRQKKTPKKA